MYYLTSRLNLEQTTTLIITVIDGQNEDEIIKYLNDSNVKFHPCLPITLFSNSFYLVTFNFNQQNIKIMNDWYPNVCNLFTEIDNEYMFNVQFAEIGANDVRFNNLHVDHHLFESKPFGIFWTTLGVRLVCDCTFSHIYFNYTADNFPIIAAYTFNFAGTTPSVTFQNITINNKNYFIDVDMIKIRLSTATNLYSKQSFIRTEFIDIRGCIFRNIYLDGVLFYFAKIASSRQLLLISNFTNIYKGGIFDIDLINDAVFYFSSNVISTNQTYHNINKLFRIDGEFDNNNNEIHFDDNHINYFYNLYANCMVDGIVNISTTTVINVSCVNPIVFIYATRSSVFLSGNVITIVYVDNNGIQITLDEYRTAIIYQYNFTDNDLDDQNVVVLFKYEDQGRMVDVAMYSHVSINDMVIKGTFGDTMMYMFDASVHFNNITTLTNENKIIYNPNNLHTNCFFYCRLCDEIIVVNSTISFANEILINIEEGSKVYMTNNNLFNSLIGIRVINRPTELQITNCSFYALGNYYADIYNVNNPVKPVSVLYTTTSAIIMLVTITVNKFIYYSVGGLTEFIVNNKNATITFKDNRFEVKNYNNTIWYKHINITQSFDNNVAAPMEFRIWNNVKGNNMKLINNIFINTIDALIPTIFVENVLSEHKFIMCSSGNEFYNYAISIQSVYLTSCFRSKLYETFLEKDYDECNDIRYGPLNYELSELQNVFTVTDANISVIKILNSTVALDNSLFNISASVKTNYSIVAVDGTNEFVLMDSAINNPMAGITYDENSCKVVFNKIYNINTIEYVTVREITQISVLCNNNNSNSTKKYKYVMYSNKTVFTNYLSPHSIVLLTRNEYFAGDQLTIQYIITDKYNNTIPVQQYNDIENIEILVESSILNLIETLSFEVNGICVLCERGIYIAQVTMDNVGSEYLLQTQEKQSFLFTNNITITIINCPPGYGRNDIETQCQICPDGFFNVKLNDDGETCHSCDPHRNSGIKCANQEIKIVHHYWMKIISTGSNSQIVSSLCPFGYCCALKNGCNFMTNVSYLCSENRDANSDLCSKCIDGYSELFLSTACGDCNATYYLWLLFPFVLALLVVLFLLCLKSSPKNQKMQQRKSKKCNNCMCRYLKKKWRNLSHSVDKLLEKNKALLRMIQIMTMRCILYYQQSISQIFLNSNININITAFSSIFNLSILDWGHSTSSEDGWCFIKNMNGQQKILSGFFVIAMLAFLLFFSYLIYKYIYQFSMLLFNRKPNFAKTFVSVTLLCVGQILSILFKLMACQGIGESTNDIVHFYFGYAKCFDTIWWLSVFGLAVIISIFVIFLIFLKRMDDTMRQNDHDNILRPLTISYKPQFYYFEIILLIRRMLIAFLSISFGSNVYSKFALVIVL
eukprot:25513_1